MFLLIAVEFYFYNLSRPSSLNWIFDIVFYLQVAQYLLIFHSDFFELQYGYMKQMLY